MCCHKSIKVTDYCTRETQKNLSSAEDEQHLQQVEGVTSWQNFAPDKTDPGQQKCECAYMYWKIRSERRS